MVMPTQEPWEGLQGSNTAPNLLLTRRLRILSRRRCLWLLQPVARKIWQQERGRSKELSTLISTISCKDKPSHEGRPLQRARAKEELIKSIWRPMKLTTIQKITHYCLVRHAVRSWRKMVKLLTNFPIKSLVKQRLQKQKMKTKQKRQMRNQRKLSAEKLLRISKNRLQSRIKKQ